MERRNPLDAFKEEAPEVQQAFDGLIQSLIKTQGLDPKTKQLIYIAMKVALGDPVAVKFHVPMAKQLGATRDEVKDAILLTLTVCGIRGVAQCLGDAMDIYDNM